MKHLLVLALIVATPCFALEDTPENRATEADRFLAAAPPAEFLSETTSAIAKKMPEAQREQFVTLMAKNLDVPALTAAMKASLIKTFTADELKALADFYGSPIGKSSMKKFRLYMADVAPPMQTELKKAFEKTQAALPAAPSTP